MNYLNPLIKAFEEAANPGRAQSMKGYMKDLFSFYGIDSKARRNIQKEFLKINGTPEKAQLFAVLFSLWELPQREFQYFAIDLLIKFEKKLEKGDIFQIEKLITSKSWWDSVDGIAAWACGAYFKLYPEEIKQITGNWAESPNIWLQRSSLLFQLKYKKKTDTDLLAIYIDKLKDSKEFFIRKAIGWVLREYSKTNPTWVREFVNTNKLSPLSYREASKYI